MEVNHMGWKLVSGVKQDVINLFKLFASTNSLRYSEFCKVWKQMKFSLIFSNRTTFIEILEFTEEVLQIVKKYLLSVYEFSTRVAALYTLYGLYFKQPIRNAAKIRFTLSEWEEFYSLISLCHTEKHYDIVYIYLKLYLNDAYSFTVTSRTVGLERGFRKYFEKRYRVPSSNYDVDLLYRPVISENLVQSLIKLESLYCKKKSALLGKNNLVFIDGDFAISLQKELKNYAAKCQGGTSKSDVGNKIMGDASTSAEGGEVTASRTRDPNRQTDSANEFGQTDVEKVELKQLKRQRVSRQLQLIAKRKAEFYIKKLREKDPQEDHESESSQSLNMNLPELDSP